MTTGTSMELSTTEAAKQAVILTLSGVTPYLIGPPGIGKTETIKSIEDKNELIFTDRIKKFVESKFDKKFEDIHIAVKSTELHTLPEEYLSGLPDYTKDRKATVWTTPEIIMELNKLASENDFVIWFVDDIHRASKSKQDYFFELETHRSIHGHKLKDNVFIIAAGNSSAEAGRVKMLTPIVSRFCFIRVNLTPEVWINDYAVRHDVHPFIITFLSQPENKKHFITSESQEPFSTPRTWVKLSEYLKSLEYIYDAPIHKLSKSNPDIMKQIITVACGLVKKESAIDFIKYVAVMSEINIRDIINDPSKFKDISKSMTKSLIFIYFLTSYIVEKLLNNTITKEEIESINNLLITIIKDNPVFGNILITSLIENVKRMIQAKDENKISKIKEIFSRNIIKKLRKH